MPKKFGPQLERLWAVAVTPRAIAIGGERDADGVTSSEVHVLDGEGRAQASIAVPAPVYALGWAFDDILIIGTADGALRGHATAEPDAPPVFAQPAHTGAVRAIVVDRMGKRLWTTGDDGEVRSFRVEGGHLQPVHQRSLGGSPQLALAIDDGERWLAAAGNDGRARLLFVDGLAEEAVKTIVIGDGPICSLAFTPDGRLAAGGDDGSVRFVYLEGQPDEEDRSGDDRHQGAVMGLVFGPSLTDDADRPLPRRLFSAGDDGAVRAWLYDTKRKPKTVSLGTAKLRGLVWQPPPEGAAPTHRGGRLVLVDARRQLTVISLDDKGEIVEERLEVESRLQELGKDLKGSSEQVRQTALQQLAALPEDPARRYIERCLDRDRKANLRILAAQALGETGRRRSRPALKKAFDDSDSGVRIAALAALAALYPDDPLAAVRAGLSAHYADLRLECVRRLPALRTASPLVPGLVAERLTDADAEVRRAALDGLYALSPDDSIAPSRVAYTRGPEDIRAAALVRLARQGASTASEGRAVVEMALDDEADVVRRTAFALLAATRPRLVAALRARDPDFAQALADLEGDAPFVEVVPDGPLDDDDRGPLFAATASRNASTALDGATRLAAVQDRRSIGLLMQLSREADAHIRTQALAGLLVAARAFPGDDRIRARIEWLLDDPDSALRARTFDGLMDLAAEAPVAVLDLAELALTVGAGDIRARALPLLIELGPEGKYSAAGLFAQADLLLADALDDEDEPVRTEAFRTLWAWHRSEAQVALERAARSRHADVRKRVVTELQRFEEPWAERLLMSMLQDSASEVGLAAYQVLLKRPDHPQRSDLHLAAMASPRPDVRAKACESCTKAPAEPLRTQLYALVDDRNPSVHLKAIEAVDVLLPDDPIPYARAFESPFYELRIRAAELLGRRRQARGIDPMRALLSIPATHLNRPPDALRQRAAAAIADAGDPASVDFLVSLLDDADPLVREQAGRGLATACRADNSQPLVDALAHADLPVRSWAAEGLARLGDVRAVPVLAGTLAHPHRPLRQGAVIGLVALGPDGIRGVLQGLEDPDRALQDLALGIIVARDAVLARMGLAPDLLLTALAASHPELRYAAARVLETRDDGEGIGTVARALVGPTPPQKAADAKEWPTDDEQAALLNVVVSALASDHPAQRYAAARVLSMRDQPLAYWREAKRLARPSLGDQPWVPRTGWEQEVVQPRKRDWVRRLFGPTERKATRDGQFAAPPTTSSGEFYRMDIIRLVFGTYAGLIRQAPPAGDADETHRVRRDAVLRLVDLVGDPEIGQGPVLPVLRRALNDPHHLVRRAAATGLQSLYPPPSVEPQRLVLASSSVDVGRAAINALLERASEGDERARAAALAALDAPAPEVRAHALSRAPRLFAPGSLEPWFLALQSKFADVRLAVVDRLIDAQDPRVAEALGRALESDHEDLRLKAALGLARQGDLRTLDVLAGFLRAEDPNICRQALEALVGLPQVRPGSAGPESADLVARVVAGRLEEDPDRTADRPALLSALGALRSVQAAPILTALLEDEEASTRRQAFAALVALARPDGLPDREEPDGTRRARYVDDVLLSLLSAVERSKDPELRAAMAPVLGDVDDPQADVLLGRRVEDRDQAVRVAAAEAMVRRVRYVADASTAGLERALQTERRELVLPAALGLAERGRAEAFQPLMLVFKAGQPDERRRAVFGLGTLGDPRALEELYRLVDDDAEIAPDDVHVALAAVEAFGAVLPRLSDPAEQSRARQTLDRLATSGSLERRKAAFAGLRRAGDAVSRALVQRIAGDAAEPVPIRTAALRTLAELADPSSETVLADALNQSQLRFEALAALEQIFADDRTKVSLLALQSRHADIAQPAAIYLAKEGDPQALIHHIADIKDRRVRRRVRQGLIRRQAFVREALPPLLEEARPEPREEAAWLAGASGDDRLAESVVKAARRAEAAWQTERVEGAADRPLAAEEEAWLAALWAAGRLGSAGRDVARSALRAEPAAPERVQAESVRYLGHHGEGSDAALVEPLLSSVHASVRTAAATAMARLAPDTSGDLLTRTVVVDPAAVVPLVDAALTTAGSGLLAQASSRYLALPRALGTARTDVLIETATRTGDVATRVAALSALGRLASAEVETALQGVLAHADAPDEVRAAAFRALRRVQRALVVAYADDQDQQRTDRARGRSSSVDDEAYDDEDDEDYDDDDELDDDELDDDDEPMEDDD